MDPGDGREDSTQMKKQESTTCQFCLSDLKPGEWHDEFDFYKHPDAKRTLLELKKKYDALPEDEKLYSMENYAVSKNLLRWPTIGVIEVEEGRGQKKPMGGAVVMPGYSRLVEADRWLRKLSDQEGEVDKIGEQGEKKGERESQNDLPF